MVAAVTEFDSDGFLKTLSHGPGVYRMLGEGGKLLYVGKAKDLKKRVASYFRRSGLAHRTQSMMQHARQVEVTVTHTEAEALLLENNLIKQHRPRYNVLLRDDKSYPYIHISLDQPYPRLAFHRGARRGKGRYFGPYPSAGAVRETLGLLQKLFRVRQCEDTFFKARTRPCLQYQIKRCTAPCVMHIDTESYLTDVQHAVRFLEGKSSEVVESLIGFMERAAEKLDFEKAALYRDQIESLRRISQRQYISGESGNLDIVACAQAQDTACVQVFNIRNGLNLGNKSFYPVIPGKIDEATLLMAFMGQYYLNRDVPERIVISHLLEDRSILEEMLKNKCGHQVKVIQALRGERARWLDLARRNADHALHARLATKAGQLKRLQALQEVLDLDVLPTRMECFDVSHTSGEATVASCVVFDAQGPLKSDYRRFNIEGITAGDDYAAMRQVLLRRYKRLKQAQAKLPEILFIDGGKGQLSQAEQVFAELAVEGVLLVAVAKGSGRRPGLESLLLSGSAGGATILAEHSPALHLIQQIRDEAHRFAITGHRQRRSKARSQSPLQQITGLGPKRRQQLLKHFGGLRGIERAGVEELVNVPGISDRLAQLIYDAFHTHPSR
ncbi:MAG: excinuclease ABC subunit UvrC [Gammaproteobacteria bacterium]|nr:excinuclease ABC subunit UvrC [Gammaproteobacteria bacterium]